MRITLQFTTEEGYFWNTWGYYTDLELAQKEQKNLKNNPAVTNTYLIIDNGDKHD